jgi:ATP/maltotriose-dependent transcriptional regulator MalT/two-component SAPR family response regulator
MDSIIINTKITPDFRHPNIIPRLDLVKSLTANSYKNLINLYAGAGYGKTTLAMEFLSSTKYNFAWYKIDKSDDNLFSFFSYIVHAINFKEKTFGKNSLDIIESVKSRTNIKTNLDNIIQTVIGTLLNEFTAKIKGNFYLVLDDFHLLPKDEWVSKTMSFLIGIIPENFHIIITTREKLPFDLSHFISKRKYFELNNANLKFTIKEIKRLSTQIYDKNFSDKELSDIVKHFDGWVTGLHLFLLSNETKDLNVENRKLPQHIYNFFSENIFAAKSEERKNFLMNTCMLENFTSESCDYILNIHRSEKILNDLLDRNIFIKRQEVKDGTKNIIRYNYQELFKGFLITKFNDLKSQEERQENLRKIAEYYIKSGDIINAIKYLLIAGDFEKCIELIIKIIHSVIKSGNLSIINQWLSNLPADLKKKNPHILYYSGIIEKNYFGNLEEALKYFRLASGFTKTPDKELYIKINTQIAEINISLGRTEQAEKDLNALLKQKLNGESKINIIYWLAVCHYHKSDYKSALKLLHESLDLISTSKSKELTTEISNVLGNIYLVQGNFTKSLFHYEKVINQTRNIYNKFQTLTNVVQLYSHSGQYEKAKKTLDEAEEMQNLFTTPFFKINFLLAGTHLSYMVGDYERAIVILNELLKLAQKSNISYYIYSSYVTLGYCYFYLKKFSKTEQYFEMAKEFVDELNETEKVDFDFSYAILKKEISFSDNIEKDLKIAYDYFAANGMIYNMVQAGYHLADFYLRKRDFRETEKYLNESFGIISENEYISLVQAEIFFDRRLFDYAIENKIQTEFINTVFSDSASLVNYAWISDAYKNRLVTYIDKLYDIKLECFGGIRIKKRGIEITDDKWIRKIRKLIFAYIILHKDKHLTKENIIDLFYPESTPENADNIFHQTISNIRAAFKEENENTSPYITYSDKIIEFNKYYFYYTDNSEFEKLYKKAVGYGIPEEEKLKYIQKALEIYKGKFLEGYYQSWCEQLSEKYIDMHLKLLDDILKIYKSREDYKNILYYSEKLLLSDNLNEDAYLDIIESEVKLGNTASAKKKYKLMQKTFKSELKDLPSKNTLIKIEKILKSDFSLVENKVN